jgi:hypothetical protein
MAIPCEVTMKHLATLSLNHDKPIMMDYWSGSHNGDIVLGVRENGDKLLVKSEDEYTSLIQKLYRVDSPDKNIIVMTENSLYIVAGNIKSKKMD